MLRFAQHDYLRVLVIISLLAIVTVMVGKTQGAEPKGRVVLYTSVDEPYARPIVREFERRTGIEVVLKTDTEASKSVGLAEARAGGEGQSAGGCVVEQRAVSYGGAGREGLLVSYKSPSAGDVDAAYVGAGDLWAGVGLRARVIAVSGAAEEGGYVQGLSLADLTEPLLRGKVAMARPTAGTTGGHVAARVRRVGG